MRRLNFQRGMLMLSLRYMKREFRMSAHEVEQDLNQRRGATGTKLLLQILGLAWLAAECVLIWPGLLIVAASNAGGVHGSFDTLLLMLGALVIAWPFGAIAALYVLAGCRLLWPGMGRPVVVTSPDALWPESVLGAVLAAAFGLAAYAFGA